MKKLILGIALFGGLSAANAQIDLGVKGGLNFPTLSGDSRQLYENQTKFRTDFYVGGYANYKITDQISFQPELLYSKQGAGLKTNDNSKAKLITHNINIPLMGRYEIMDGLNVEFGPQLGFLVSAKEKYELGKENTKIKATDNFKTFDFGLNFGAAYKITDELEINARFTKGLSNINDYYPQTVNDNYKITNTYFSVGVAYKLAEM
ncbi:PorT family protein [Empedobacter falsenii]|uniref:porin family protein n=1 Tax=Empedobacter TaxID=59734 RepID=UPI0025754858|nr:MULTISPECIES: porin family protein [Empedobacter]MDM1041117.1 PorT family protein [Empedobacter brevis]MDM1061236.1 PorT family protein [Empedobacter falsenii]MDM1134819.1 PorT family protein [Empedobacter sp. R750]MDM1546530.1 PorT family protein [Empedobacter falsenii]